MTIFFISLNWISKKTFYQLHSKYQRKGFTQKVKDVTKITNKYELLQINIFIKIIITGYRV